MSMWLQNKYINLMSNQFSVFKRKNNKLYNVRCPECGDSKKNKFKARGYFYLAKDKWNYKCHNCGYGVSVPNFMKKHNPQLYKEYTIDLLRERDTKGETMDQPKVPVVKIDKDPLKLITKISSLPHQHIAKQFISERKIPNIYHKDLFYTANFTKLVNKLIPNKLKELEEDPRIIIPLFTEKKSMFGFQGRALSSDGLRYITILLDESRPKIFGLDNVDFSKKIYVFEGPFDSMFVDNSLAVCGSDIVTTLSSIPGVIKENINIVYDNEPRSPIILKKIESAINSGYNVVIWPNNINEKDVNDMILSGMSQADIKLTLDCNVHSDLSAKLALSAYRR